MNNMPRVEYTPPEKWYKRATWTLTQDFKSESGITVPVGFVSDGVSFPIFLRPFINPTGLGFKSALVHDYLLAEGYSWEDALERFEAQLEIDGVPLWYKTLFVKGVELWGLFQQKS